MAKAAAKTTVPASGSVRFRAMIIQSGKTATGIEVPPEVVAKLGTSKKPAVSVTINGYTYRSTIATMGGKFMVGVSSDTRDQAKVAGGDVVDVDIALDTAPREIILPPDFAKALGKDAQAKKFFESLSYSNKRRLVEPIAAIKTPETRERRIAKTIANLHDGKA